MVRVCEGDDDPCLSGGAWAASDDGCGGDCPRTEFPCPPAGAYTTWVASYGSNAAPACTVHAETSDLPDPTEACGGGAPTGDLRECGWTNALTGTCTPGDAIWVGCDPYTCGLDVCPDDDVPDTLEGMVCSGDPMLRACRGAEPCHAREALALNEDACRASCPAAVLTCPAEGQFTVLTAPERDGRTYDCDLGYASVSELNVPDTGTP
jgi:hypothetical protein